jgi:hypothetical protein
LSYLSYSSIVVNVSSSKMSVKKYRYEYSKAGYSAYSLV